VAPINPGLKLLLLLKMFSISKRPAVLARAVLLQVTFAEILAESSAANEPSRVVELPA